MPLVPANTQVAALRQPRNTVGLAPPSTLCYNVRNMMTVHPALLLGLFALTVSPHPRCDVAVVSAPDTSQPNTHYAGNRAPLLPSPFLKLPLKAIRPEGWLRAQLELQAAGFHGHLDEVSRFMNKTNNAWLDPLGRGDHGWEEVPYWLKGFGDCAYLLEDQAQIREAKVWIEGALGSQQPDGWFGPGEGRGGSATDITGREDLWPNMIMLMCLQSYHEFSGDPRVLEAMRRYFDYQMKLPEERFCHRVLGHQPRGGQSLERALALQPDGRAVAARTRRKDPTPHRQLDRHHPQLAQRQPRPRLRRSHLFLARNPKTPNTWPPPNATGRPSASQYGQVPGGMFGGDENCRPGFDDPRQAVETCGMVEMMFSHERLFAVTGKPIWADRCEDVAFNSLPAALLPDFKGLRYLTAPNLILSDRHNKAPGYQNGGPMLLFNPPFPSLLPAQLRPRLALLRRTPLDGHPGQRPRRRPLRRQPRPRQGRRRHRSDHRGNHPLPFRGSDRVPPEHTGSSHVSPLPTHPRLVLEGRSAHQWRPGANRSPPAHLRAHRTRVERRRHRRPRSSHVGVAAQVDKEPPERLGGSRAAHLLAQDRRTLRPRRRHRQVASLGNPPHHPLELRARARSHRSRTVLPRGHEAMAGVQPALHPPGRARRTARPGPTNPRMAGRSPRTRRLAPR